MNKLFDEVKLFIKDVKELMNIDDEYEYEVKPREKSNDIITNDINDLYEMDVTIENIVINNDDKKMEIEYK